MLLCIINVQINPIFPFPLSSFQAFSNKIFSYLDDLSIKFDILKNFPGKYNFM